MSIYTSIRFTISDLKLDKVQVLAAAQDEVEIVAHG